MALSGGIVKKLFEEELGLTPVLQVVEVKPLGSETNRRFRLVVSDGSHFLQGMLATQLNELVENGTIGTGSIVQVTDYMCNTIQNRKILIILQMTVVQPGAAPIQGSPVSYPDGTPLGASAGGGGGGAGGPTPPRSPAKPAPQAAAPPAAAPASAPEPSPIKAGGQYGAPPPSYKPVGSGAVAKDTSAVLVTPILALNPYQNKWTIRVRCTAKSPIRNFNGQRGPGKVQSVDLLDAEGGEIRATMFNQVQDRFGEVFQVGKVYLVSKAGLKPARKQYNNLNADFEIWLENTSEVTEVTDDSSAGGGGIKLANYSFTRIADLESVEAGRVVDLVGVVQSVGDVSTIITKKDARELQKRDIVLMDETATCVQLTLWGDLATSMGNELAGTDQGHPVVAVKGGKLGDFGGRSVSSISSTQIQVNPDVPEAHVIKGWYEQDGRNAAPQSISDKRSSLGGGRGPFSDRKFVAQIQDEFMGRGEPRGVWCQIKGTITYMRSENMYYPACPNMLQETGRQCNKKTREDGMNGFYCERCAMHCAEPDYRYMMSIQVADHTGGNWMSVFNDEGKALLGCEAKELEEMRRSGDTDGVNAKVQSALYKEHVFKVLVREEMYQDEVKQKVTVRAVTPVDFVAETQYMLDQLDLCAKGLPSVLTEVSSRSNASNFNTPSTATPAYVGGGGGGGYGGGGYGGGAEKYKSLNSGGRGEEGPYGDQGAAHRTATGGVRASGGGGGSKDCFKCGSSAHWARDCDNSGPGAARPQGTSAGGGGYGGGGYGGGGGYVGGY